MKDFDIVEKLKKIIPNAKFEFENERCTSIDLTDDNYIFHGLIRNYSDTSKKEIIQYISKFQNLKKLNLRKNKLLQIPDFDLYNLEFLDLGSNYLKKTPIFFKNSNLKYLNLGVNELKEIPEWFNDFSNLETIKLHKNKLNSINNIDNCKKIKFFNIYFNLIKKIPDFIWNYKKVEFFSWGISGITQISDKIANWENLNWLSLVSNKLETIPDCICFLKNIKGLRLHKNKIKYLPENIGLLDKLEQLTLYNNQIKNLPESFKYLKLKKLNIARNKFEKKPILYSDWLCYNDFDCNW